MSIPTTQDGRLEVNDQLIEVNGNSLLGISNEQALNVLKTCMMIENSSVIQVKEKIIVIIYFIIL